MEPLPDSQPSHSLPKNTERLKVLEISRQKHPVLQAVGQYSFDDIKTEGPIRCQWHFQKEHVGLTVVGEVQGCLVLECARCLEPYPVPVDLRINERFVYEDSLASREKERELQSDDFYETLDEAGELDLKDLAHQFLILESLNHPNCQRPECRFA